MFNDLHGELLNCVQSEIDSSLPNIIKGDLTNPWDDGVKIYNELNGGKLYNKIKIVKLPKDKDICDLKGQIDEYYYEIK